MMVQSTNTTRTCAHCYQSEKDISLQQCARCVTTKYCSRDCQKKDWKKHKPLCAAPLSKSDQQLDSLHNVKLYSIENIPGKGKGVVASQDIPRGTRIFSERAIFTMPTDAFDPHQSLFSKVESLEVAKREAFYDLHNAHLGDLPVTTGIVKTNALPLGNDAVEGGIFLEASRINHSCSPNAQNTWNANLNRITIHASRDIKKGEEICIHYLRDTEIYATRQRELQIRFGFACNCSLCSLPIAKRLLSDEKLQEIIELDEVIGDGISIVMSPLSCLYSVKKSLDLLKEEGVEDARVPRLYYDAMQVAIANGDQARAKIFAERALAGRMILEGNDSPEVAHLRCFVNAPSSHRLFGTTQAWKQSLAKIPRDLCQSDFENWLWKRRV